MTPPIEAFSRNQACAAAFSQYVPGLMVTLLIDLNAWFTMYKGAPLNEIS